MKRNDLLLSVVIVCLSIVICSTIFSKTFLNRNRMNNIITVTGAAKQDFTSDLIEWNLEIARSQIALKSAFSEITADSQLVKKFLLGKGILETEMIIGAVSIQKEYDTITDSKGMVRNIFKGFKLTQNFKIESKDVEKVEIVSREITDLINSGVEVYSSLPNYYYTKLGELKIEMIAEATKDGRLRAEQIAKNSGGNLGDLRFSNLGIFQIAGQNSNVDFSYGGVFDTLSKRKRASITVKLQFGL